MATTKSSAQNVMVEDLNNGTFRRTVFNEPAKQHEMLPVSFAPAGADTFVLGLENEVVSVDATNGAVQVNLPSVKGNAGKKYTVKNRKGVNTVTLTPVSGEFVDDGVSIPLVNKGDTVSVIGFDDSIQSRWIVTSCCVDIS